MNQNEVRTSYDKESARWGNLILSGDAFLQKNKYFFDLLKRRQARTILDAGCGNGMQSIEFARKGFRVTGLDFSSGMIREAKKNAHGVRNATFVQGDMNAYRFHHKFNAIWANTSLHNMNLTTLKKSLHTLSGLLEREGILAIKMRHGVFEGRKVRNGISRYYRYSGPREIKSLLKGSGLEWQHTEFSVRLGIPMFQIYFVKKES